MPAKAITMGICIIFKAAKYLMVWSEKKASIIKSSGGRNIK
jgi:hypothetical protein